MSADFDRTTVRRKVRDLFDALDGQRSATDVAFELKEICGLHRSAVVSGGRSEEAILRLGGAVREFVAQLPRVQYAGIADALGRELADTLAVAFRRTHPERDAALRSQLVDDLWALVEVDLKRERDGWVAHLCDTFRDATTASERDTVRRRFREKLRSFDGAESSDPRRLVGDWMLEYVGRDLSDEEIDAICRETGQYVRLAERTLERGRVERALEWGAEAPAGRIADLCRAFRDADRLPALVEAGLLPDPDRASLSPDETRELAVLLLEAGVVERALSWARAALRNHQPDTTLRALRRAAREAGTYGPRLERTLLEGLERRAPEVVLDYHLEFGDLGEAFDVWDDDDHWADGERSRAAKRLLEAAESVGAVDVTVAVATRRADELVERRGRDNYEVACEYLAAARRVVENDDGPWEWEMLIGEYEERLDRLPAFRDEAMKAGLVS